ncbi:MAG: hypothetical protein ACREX9_01870 [Gammaproteobacteria bacterium]
MLYPVGVNAWRQSSKRGAHQWRADIRRKGYPRQIRTFTNKADAKLWAQEMESAMNRRVWISSTEAENTSLCDTLARYLREVTLVKKGAKQETYRIKAWMRHPLANRALASIRGWTSPPSATSEWLRAVVRLGE